MEAPPGGPGKAGLLERGLWVREEAIASVAGPQDGGGSSRGGGSKACRPRPWSWPSPRTGAAGSGAQSFTPSGRVGQLLQSQVLSAAEVSPRALGGH